MTYQTKLHPNFYIGHALDNYTRFKASSGGIGTAVTRYLLSLEEFGTSMTFFFNKEKKMYEPKLIYSPEDLNICGSIYQDINITEFVRTCLLKVKGGFIVSCPPCQVSAVRSILDKKGIKSFIISFCCSGQNTIEGTWKYYEFLGIKKEDVANMQYRGNGWPSGIQIELADGKKVYHENWTEPWKTIHTAGLYKPKRCYYCTFDSSYKSDISLADPWLKDYIGKDTIGNTLFFSNTTLGCSVIREMKMLKIIDYIETDYNSYYTAQQSNVEKYNKKKKQQRNIKREVKLMENPCVRHYFSQSFSRMKKYIKFRRYVVDFSSPLNIYIKLKNIARRIKKSSLYPQQK